MKIIAPSPITSWQIAREKVETFYFVGLQNHCEQWLQPQNSKMLASWKERNDKPRQRIIKQRRHFAEKGSYSHAVMYKCGSWTIKKAERWRIDPFKLWSLRRLLRVSWIARRSSQSILREINPEYSLEGPMLKLKLQHSPDAKSWLIGKDLEAGKVWGHEEKEETADEMVGWNPWLNGHEFE